MNNQRFTSVWDAIEDTPEEAENMKLRSVLMTALKNHLTRTEMSQAQAAKLLGVTWSTWQRPQACTSKFGCTKPPEAPHPSAYTTQRVTTHNTTGTVAMPSAVDTVTPAVISSWATS